MGSPEPMESLAAAVVAAFKTENVPTLLSEHLQEALGPTITFLRVSVRSGRGLFVSDNLLRPGPMQPSLVSLSNSLAGAAMRARQPIILNAAAACPASAVSGSRCSAGVMPLKGLAQVWCLPSAHAPDMPLPANDERTSMDLDEAVATAGCGCSHAAALTATAEQLQKLRPVYVGALMAGLSAPADEPMAAALQELSHALAPYLVILLLSKVGEMAHLLALHAADAAALDGEEDALQDLPASGSASSPPPPPPPSALLAAAPPAMAQAAAVAVLAAVPPERAQAVAAMMAGASADQQAHANEAAVVALQRQSRMEVAPHGHSSTLGAGPGWKNPSVFAGLATPEDEVRSSKEVAQHGLRNDTPGGGADGELEWSAEKPAKPALDSVSSPAPALPRHPLLLTFTGPGQEAAYAMRFNAGQVSSDALFACLFLAESALIAGLGGTTAASLPRVSAVILAALVLVAAVAGRSGRYASCRELLVAALLLAQAISRKGMRADRLAAAMAPGGAGGLGAVYSLASLTVAPLVWQLRFVVALPVLLASAVAIFNAMSPLCGLPAVAPRAEAAAAANCSSLLLAARLGSLGLLLPALALYLIESRARARWTSSLGAEGVTRRLSVT